IPSIDLMQGKCVRLKQGQFDQQTEYPHDPVELARLYMDKGFRRLHIVDLEGAKKKKLMHLETLGKLRKETNLVIDYGGGIRTRHDVEEVLKAGADYATIGSLAVREPSKVKSWMAETGAEKFIIAADLREDKVAVDAWTSGSNLKVDELIGWYLPVGLKEILCTDINRDGMLEGVNAELYKRLKEAFPGIGIIASGGVASLEDLRLLDQYKVDAAVIGKALYEGWLDLDELSEFGLQD
ncbi:MAG: 1-(5-phosphoribosyl)-5-[(5-phosphoribosylamino)methylideneamino]imidazole-4-carboxamide isomerase, partial [Bacteroidales bacterium]|nr:1-(5-phosphoribosyl)-5-[(5-phosphoribosylamino)methylideneamino]imidazole-4-carboxamide isomerase [Bacteroidales bacterium]